MIQGDDTQPLQVPHVFVVPPEEDEAPVWHCFDAALPIDQRMAQSPELETEIQIFDPTVDYDDEDDEDAVGGMARRNTETRSIVETLMARNYNIDHTARDSDSDLEWDSESEYQPRSLRSPPQKPNPPRPELDAGNDSDVIEVVKVSRSTRHIDDASNHPAPPNQGLKRTTTFKSRATKVLRSFTGTFRSSKTQGQDNLPPRPSSSMSHMVRQDENREERKQTLSRPTGSVSRRFSQLFTVSSVRSRNSPASDAESPPMESAPFSPESIVLTRSSSERRPSVSYDTAPLPRRSSIYQESIPPDTLSRAASPNPSTSGKSTRRFSKLNLQRMFTFSSTPSPVEDSAPPDVVSGRTTPTLKRKSSSLPSTSSDSSGPQTPTSTEHVGIRRSTITYDDKGHSPQLDFGDFETGLGIIAPRLSLSQSQGPAPRMSTSSSASSYSRSSAATTTFIPSSSKQQSGGPLDDGGDDLLEMRLDSLHFDSLSFDADQFLVD